MLWKMTKVAIVAVAAVALVGGVLFGRDALSYARTSVNSAQSAVKSSVPIEFELNRARTLLEQITPEVHAGIRRIAEEEVALAALEQQIAEHRRRIAEERDRVATLRAMLDEPDTSFVLAGQRYERSAVRDDLGRRLERVREADNALTNKRQLLETRREALHGAREALEQTRSHKGTLEDRIAGLEAQHRLLQAASVGSTVEIDRSALNQTRELIDRIEKRLAVSERVLAEEARFRQPIPLEPAVTEQELLRRADELLAGSGDRDTAEDGPALGQLP